MANEELERQLEAPMQAATDAIRTAVLRLQDSEVHPQLVVLMVTRVTDILAANAALAARMSGRCWTSWPRSCARPAGSA